MTAGEYLVALSGLVSGSAAQHLLAIQSNHNAGGTTLSSLLFVLSGGEELSALSRDTTATTIKVSVDPDKTEVEKGRLYKVVRSLNLAVTAKNGQMFVTRQQGLTLTTRDYRRTSIVTKRKQK